MIKIKNDMGKYVGAAPYCGSLASYFDEPRQREFGDVLSFLQRVVNKDDVYLVDILDWNIQDMPPLGYSTYIFCSFGEAVNDVYLEKLINDSRFNDVRLILITSQTGKTKYHDKMKVFRLEYMHHLVKFFPQINYLPLSKRRYRHGSLSHRNEVHKSFITACLKEKTQSYVYSLCDYPGVDYNQKSFAKEAKHRIDFDSSALEQQWIKRLHELPVCLPGGQWSIDVEPCYNAQVHWVLESIFLSLPDEFNGYLSEKIVKAIVSGCMFIVVGQRGAYERLRELGFETFEDTFRIPTSYYNMRDNDRLRFFADLMDNFSPAQRQDFVDYNYNYFFTNFFDSIEEQNKDRIEAILEYINA